MRGIFLTIIVLSLLQVSFSLKTNLAVNSCVTSQCSKFNCSGKVDEYACKIATNQYNSSFKQPDCVLFLTKYQDLSREVDFPMHEWVPCRYVAYNVYYTSPTMDSFLDCQDQCIDKDYD